VGVVMVVMVMMVMMMIAVDSNITTKQQSKK
jgi:hypothetical protein